MASRPSTPPEHYSMHDDFSYPSPQDYHEAHSLNGAAHSHSGQDFSINMQMHGMDNFEGSHNDLAGTMGAGNGLGSLADELAEAWYGDEEYEEEGAGGATEGYTFSGDLPIRSIPSPTKLSTYGDTDGRLSPKKDAHFNRHRRLQSQYDGSDYGNDSDLEESPGITSGLEARMAVIESLARRGTEENGGEGDTVVERVVNGLRDLGGQSGVEGGATRLITAHTALSTHLTHQTRTLHSLAFPLFSPLSVPPDGDAIDELLPILSDTATLVPQPSAAALSSLSQLSYLTTDLVRMLDHLSDSLHMSRQTTTAAARRLRSARELTAEMRRETDAREESERWIERGSWQTRLAERQCATVCREVVGGFEEVCQGWRDRLVAAAEVGAG
ncbi:hypothetical protein L228DRAFT_243912 [Xylona heveae TC161]|uniref:Uncharacterized protein n=1 Tax=Xylona heveae (strain CBS 132557 / TC161) TaxID=1328760 RepID=A0A165IMR9_XYLHT|nr:hypothetical protein L228DRAFT_243912 [Xylona heveae TC161]KZF25120.1 hypothetical protein L228DRAFT_243912 [Xylona heveae TC161]